MRRHSAVLLMLVAAPALAAGQGRLAATAPIWSGSVRCDVDVKGPGYTNHQTHTWTLTGAPPADGGVLDYPGTWTVSGEGSLQPSGTQGSTATWKTQGSAPGVRMAISVRPSDQRLLVFLRHGQLSAPNGTTGTQQQAALGAVRARNQPIALTVSEWRPFPTIDDGPTSTHVSGSKVSRFTERLDYLQTAGSEGQATCTWDLVQSGATTASAATAQMVKPTPIALAGPVGKTTPPPQPTPPAAAAPYREGILAPGAAQAAAASAAAAAAAAAATSCHGAPGTSASFEPCVTISGPAQLTAGMSGTYALQFKNSSPNVATTIYPDGSSVAVTTDVKASFTFDSNEGETQTRNQTVTAASGGTPSLSATFTFQTPGAYPVMVSGTISVVVTRTTTRVQYDANKKPVATTVTQDSQATALYNSSVKQVVTVTAP